MVQPTNQLSTSGSRAELTEETNEWEQTRPAHNALLLCTLSKEHTTKAVCHSPIFLAFNFVHTK
jgi:hypothetical protein